jgi:hypothetical protein
MPDISTSLICFETLDQRWNTFLKREQSIFLRLPVRPLGEFNFSFNFAEILQTSRGAQNRIYYKATQ